MTMWRHDHAMKIPDYYLDILQKGSVEIRKV